MKWHKLANPVELHCGDVMRVVTYVGEFDIGATGDDQRVTQVFFDRAPTSLAVTRTDGTVERVEFAKEDA